MNGISIIGLVISVLMVNVGVLMVFCGIISKMIDCAGQDIIDGILHVLLERSHESDKLVLKEINDVDFYCAEKHQPRLTKSQELVLDSIKRK